MKNMKKVFSLVMIIALATYSSINGISANAATTGVIKPQLKITGLKATYKFNSQIKFNIATSNYPRKVKYKVSLYSFDTKKTLDLTKGFSKSIGGSKYFTLSTLPKGSGKYKLEIYIKALASKASYDNYIEKPFAIEANKTAIVSELKYAEALAESKTVGNKIGNVLSPDMVKYKNVINVANAVKDNFYSSQTEVNAKVKALATASVVFKNSVVEPVDKTALVNAIKAAQQKVSSVPTGTLPLQTGQVSIQDKMTLIKAITSATSVAVDEYATVENVNTAIAQLNGEVAAFGNKLQGSGI